MGVLGSVLSHHFDLSSNEELLLGMGFVAIIVVICVPLVAINREKNYAS